MKGKRGSKKGHKKVKTHETPVMVDPTSAPVYMNTEDTAFDQSDDSQQNSEMDIRPSSVGSDKPNILTSEGDDKLKEKVGHNRLRVKLISSKVTEPQKGCYDKQTSDTDKISQRASLELNDATLGKDDSSYSDGHTSDLQNTNSEKIPKKSTIKIKSSKGLSISSENVQDIHFSKMRSPHLMDERNLVSSDDKLGADSPAPRNLQQRQMKRPYEDTLYNGKELGDALEVIKKIMKMDAAGPFNVPVDPIALGIPDYFDVIDTPMDFGTICQNLEKGEKYMNSEDVFKDVEYIWENCFKYNNKGDYIVDLMKRVKKNFMKYWMMAGLYVDVPSNGASNSTPIQDSKDTSYPKGTPKHKRRRRGIDLHKSDCLCAACVMRRRRVEREQNIATGGNQVRTESNVSQEIKLEENSPATNQGSEDGSSSVDHSQETDIGEVQKEKMSTSGETGIDTPENQDATDGRMENLPGNGVQDNSVRSSEELKYFGFTRKSREKEDTNAQLRNLDEKRDQVKPGDRMKLENLAVQENPSVMHICKSLFPSDFRSIWNGPHSLKRQRASRLRDSPIQSAFVALMKH